MPTTKPRSGNLWMNACALGLGVGASVLGGCWVPGGVQMSLDMYTYHSTTYMPQTVTLIDTRSGQALFSVDIPVGKELVMQFHEGRGVKLPDGTPSELYPDKLKWDIWDLGRRFGEPTQSFDVPPFHARRVDVTVRTSPEQPDLLTPVPGVPAPQGEPTAPPTFHEVPAPQDAPSMPAPPAPPGPGVPAGVGD